ncbi:hypothetical protein DE146DRAFT_748534 [Phaeosphaeria sp. MPI-PUGE-AT-0046c]|nr:hypothetical protein DE146DRAFT_748534 [Phaeosphaeria sp. MPI-PUGE-AT-0046c]
MPPNGITAVNDARVEGTIVTLLGVVVSVKEPRRTKGTDWVLDFAIQDDFTAGHVGNDASINCRVFRSSPEQLPKAKTGDIALIRDFKLNAWMSRIDAVSIMRSGVVIFPATGIPVPELSQAYRAGTQSLPYSATSFSKDPTAQEQMAVINLKQAASGSVQQMEQFSTASSLRASTRDKLSLIKDLDFTTFYDVRAQVVNIYYNNFGNVDLKVTDYTENSSLFRYVDPDDQDYAFQRMDWKGPYGQYTLNVLLYGPNATWAREQLVMGDYVYIKNMRTKLSPANKLEGVVHEDRQRPNQVDIRKLTKASDIDEISQRRKEYEKTRTKKTAFAELQNESSESSKPSAKITAKRRAEKKARQKQQKEQEEKEIAEKEEEWEAKRNGINLNIRAAFPEVQLSTISEITYNSRLDAQTPKYNHFVFPFLNARFRARVRVVDFFPPELDLFVHCTNDPAWDKRSRKQDHRNSTTKVRWEWAFVLLLEDAKVPPNTMSEQLRVVVNNEAAQHLLDMNAQDLTKNSQLRTKLEEKLFILWGNLLELKTELRDRGKDMPLPPGDNRLQNKVFDACIEEYGHQVPITDKNKTGYQRMHRLAQTRIMV